MGKLVVRIVALNFRAEFEYRANFWMQVGYGVLWQASIIVFVTVLLGRFPGLDGWPSRAVLLIAAMRMLSHGVFVICFDRVTELANLVQEGRIDGYLLRPMPVYLQVQLSSFPSNAIGDLLVGISMFAWAVERVGIAWTPLRIGYLTAGLSGGVFMEAAIFTALSCLHLHVPAAKSWSYWTEELMSTFGNYPLRFLPGIVNGAFTFVLPLAFVAYLPAAVLTDRTGSLGVPAVIAVAAPAIGLAAYVGSRCLWRLSLRHYTGVNG